MKNLLHAIALLAMALLLILLPGCRNSRPTLIVQISDPQLGFSTESHDLSPDTAMFGEAIRRINQLQPDAVVITGDLVHECDDPVQLAMVRALLDRIDPEIAIFPLPGGHMDRRERPYVCSRAGIWALKGGCVRIVICRIYLFLVTVWSTRPSLSSM